MEWFRLQRYSTCVELERSKNCWWFLVRKFFSRTGMFWWWCMHVHCTLNQNASNRQGKKIKRTSMLQGTQLIHNFCKSMISICLLLVQSYSLQVTTNFEQSPCLGSCHPWNLTWNGRGGESNPSSKLLLWTTTLLAGTSFVISLFWSASSNTKAIALPACAW